MQCCVSGLQGLYECLQEGSMITAQQALPAFQKSLRERRVSSAGVMKDDCVNHAKAMQGKCKGWYYGD